MWRRLTAHPWIPAAIFAAGVAALGFTITAGRSHGSPITAIRTGAIDETSLADMATGVYGDRRRLKAARAQWAAAGIRSYRYEVEKSCFCQPLPRREALVQNGRARAMPGLAGMADVPGLFAVVEQAIEQRFDGLAVEYGPHGVPVKIDLNPSDSISDEETRYRIRRFRTIAR